MTKVIELDWGTEHKRDALADLQEAVAFNKSFRLRRDLQNTAEALGASRAEVDAAKRAGYACRRELRATMREALAALRGVRS